MKCESIIPTVLWLLSSRCNYLRKTISANQMANKMNGPCHYDVQHWQSVCIKKSFTIFSVMLSNWRVQHLAGYRKWRVSLKNYRNQSLRVVLQKRCSAKEFFWNCISALVFSCKLVAYLRKTFLEEHFGGLLLKYGVLCRTNQISTFLMTLADKLLQCVWPFWGIGA